VYHPQPRHTLWGVDLFGKYPHGGLSRLFPPLIDEIPMGLVGMGPHLSMDFVSQEHGVPCNGPKDSNAGG
jgi:hypothetical protein